MDRALAARMVTAPRHSNLPFVLRTLAFLTLPALPACDAATDVSPEDPAAGAEAEWTPD